jgi:hypothetical protein
MRGGWKNTLEPVRGDAERKPGHDRRIGAAAKPFSSSAGSRIAPGRRSPRAWPMGHRSGGQHQAVVILEKG